MVFSVLLYEHKLQKWTWCNTEYIWLSSENISAIVTLIPLQQHSYEEIINLENEKEKLRKANFFSPMPVHRRILADALLKLFAPCDSEADFPDGETSFSVSTDATDFICTFRGSAPVYLIKI